MKGYIDMLVIILICIIFWGSIVALVSLYNFTKAIILRFLLYKQLRKICDNNGWILLKPRKIFSSFVKFSPVPDLIIETHHKIYLIRFFTCKNKNLYYVFPTPEYCIYFERILSSFNPTGRFKYLPKFNDTYNNAKNNKTFEKIILFSPCFGKISCLNAEQTERRYIGRESYMDGWRIFNDSSFLNMLLNNKF